MLRIDFVTLFPEMMLQAMGHSMMKRAQEAGLAQFGAVNPRDFTHDRHRTVDDDPFGGGPGMVMMCQPIWDAVASLKAEGFAELAEGLCQQGNGRLEDEKESLDRSENASGSGTSPDKPGLGSTPLPPPPIAPTSRQGEGEAPTQLQSNDSNPKSTIGSPQSDIQNPKSEIRNPKSRVAIVLPDPTGRLFRQKDAAELAQMDHIIFLCGHYEGIDDRIRQLLATHVFSLGDFVLTGGELPALVMADAAVRLLPGVLGCSGSLGQDSFSDELLSAPQYTRPDVFMGLPVPEVLKSGDHGAAAKWRRKVSLETTRRCRPELFWRARLEKSDPDMLSS